MKKETRGRKRNKIYARIADKIQNAFNKGNMPLTVDVSGMNVDNPAQSIRLSADVLMVEGRIGHTLSFKRDGDLVGISLRDAIHDL